MNCTHPDCFQPYPGVNHGRCGYCGAKLVRSGPKAPWVEQAKVKHWTSEGREAFKRPVRFQSTPLEATQYELADPSVHHDEREQSNSGRYTKALDFERERWDLVGEPDD